MALPHAPTTALSNTSTSLTCFPKPLFPNKSQTHCSLVEKGKHGSPCKARKSDDEQGINQVEGKLSRRNMLIGLGAVGLYGATGGLGTNPFTTALPIPAPDLKTCMPTTEDVIGRLMSKLCCSDQFCSTEMKLKLGSFEFQYRSISRSVCNERL
ncbi:polyphenol oxidase I [Pyrus ussuriensis x Pyrus communis]|uniref:Polyphenol oxidase I n=1 Tax=Pyrus ussuriensis x Pyrus communis TaxID=2448454 RepID=A0A5N5IIP5_9ROSA|nr:polyphenol oxidase I [Pyrus ussuriensis x Pyrus communis]